jgi:hypothetical protein
VGIAPGDAAAAGTDVLVVVAHGTTTVELNVTDTQVRQLDLGQVAQVTPVGAQQALAGKVTRIGAVPATDDQGNTTYPATITLDGRNLALPTGATAAVAAVVGTAKNALTVPTSAVDQGTVLVVQNGTATPTRVTTGVVGATRVEIVDGLKAGDQVVLADLSATVPTGSQPTFAGGGGLGAGFGAGGAGGGPMRFPGGGGQPGG